MRTIVLAASVLGYLTFMGPLVSRGALREGDAKSQSVTIKGIITNLAAAKGEIGSNTYLQLVLLGPGGSVNGRFENGRWSAVSNLPKISMPPTGSKGTFSFECKDLHEGEYLVAVQLMEKAGPNFLMKQAQPLLIRSSQAKPGLTLDVGEVALPVSR